MGSCLLAAATPPAPACSSQQPPRHRATPATAPHSRAPSLSMRRWRSARQALGKSGDPSLSGGQARDGQAIRRHDAAAFGGTMGSTRPFPPTYGPMGSTTRAASASSSYRGRAVPSSSSPSPIQSARSRPSSASSKASKSAKRGKSSSSRREPCRRATASRWCGARGAICGQRTARVPETVADLQASPTKREPRPPGPALTRRPPRPWRPRMPAR